MVRLTDRPDMTLDVYRGRKTTTTNAYACVIIFSVLILMLILKCVSMGKKVI